MLITVTRDRYTDKSTIGMVDIDGVLLCYLLEPPRGDGSGLPPYCIMAGTYAGRKMWSHHFQMVVPHILDVPNRVEIEWHIGNFPKDTKGCGLVGLKRQDPDFVGFSEQALEDVMAKLPSDFTITYVDTFVPEAT